MRTVPVISILAAVVAGGSLGPTLHAQTDARCGTHTGPVERARGLVRESERKDHHRALAAGAAYTIPIAFHVVRPSDGTGGLLEPDLLIAISDANSAFAEIGIEFCRSGSTLYIDDDAYYSGIDTQDEIDQLRLIDPVPGAVNIYFTENLADESGSLCGVSSFSFSDVQGIVIANDCAPSEGNSATLQHQLGHYFDLYHTHETAFGVECVNGTNCDVAGDLVCDTPADPDLSSGGVFSCTYSNVLLGPCPGDPLYQPDPGNYMSLAPTYCRTSFTTGQGDRAVETLVALRPELIDNCPEPGPIIHVDAAAPDGGDGTSWEAAFNDLQDALEAGRSLNGLVALWVAAGTYKPDRGTGDRDLSFELSSGIAVYGGFLGGESSLDERDVVANETILSGDLDGNDVPGSDINDLSVFENSFHVVTALGTDETAILDGLTISGGTAFGAPFPRDTGGGVYVASGLITVRHCRFVENRAIIGGGIGTNNLSDLLISDSHFVRNMVFNSGGGVHNVGGQASTFDRCAFVGNIALNIYGGGMNGGGRIRDCLFAGNTCVINGGAIRTWGDSVLTNCTVVYNTAGNSGGGVDGSGFGSLTVTGCIFWGNEGALGGGETAQLTSAAISYCCIQELNYYAGNGNIGDDPAFVDPGGPDGTIGTPDDDYRLLAGSPCINAAAPLGTVDIGTQDLDGADRVQHCRVDMGAYESPLLANDCDQDGLDDECELAAGTSSDCNINGIPDGCDIADGISLDCDGNGVPDECDVAIGDCNGNGIPDACDLAEPGADCNGNGIPDDCDLAPAFAAGSGVLSPLGQGFPYSVTFLDTPIPISDVVLTFQAVGDLASSNEVVILELNNVGLGFIYSGGTGNDCPDTPDVAQVVVPVELFLDIVIGGDFTVTMTPSNSIDPDWCVGQTWIELTVDYDFEPTSDDFNGNGIPDECECPGDCAVPFNGAVDIQDLLALLAAWGSAGGACDLDGDGTIGIGDFLSILSLWGPC